LLFSKRLFPQVRFCRVDIQYCTNKQVGDSDSDAREDEEEIDFHKDSIARLKQQDITTRSMNQAEYVDYAECRQASFTYKKPLKFREWLQLDKLAPGSNTRAGSDLLDVMGFICYEMVRTLTELALKVKRVKEASNSTSLSGASLNPEMNALDQIRHSINEEYRSMDLFASPEITSPLEPWHIEEAHRRLREDGGFCF
jgi:transcription initiation protein SPT3